MTQPFMPLAESLRVLASARGDAVVVSAMAAAREWMSFSAHPLDFIFVPSSMGQCSALGMGIALAQPERQVIACNGDGSQLMNLGSLVSITAAAPANLVLIVFDNGVYEVTGLQSTPAAARGRKSEREVDFAAIARACGFDPVFRFDDLESWRRDVHDVLAAEGPTFVCLKVAPVPDAEVLKSPGPPQERARRLAEALQGTAAR